MQFIFSVCFFFSSIFNLLLFVVHAKLRTKAYTESKESDHRETETIDGEYVENIFIESDE